MAKKKLRVGNFGGGGVDIDMTPMIDMTFQLIAFFMVLINFNESQTNEKVQLPTSVLAKPPEGPLEFPITIHVTKEGRAILGGQEMQVEDLSGFLNAEAEAYESQDKSKSVKDATIIIRGHRDCPTGRIQKVIEVCQKNRFEKFALRAREEGT